MRHTRRAFVGTALVVTMSPLLAQQAPNTGRVRVIVVDPAGQPVGAASVSLLDPSGGILRTFNTESQGDQNAGVAVWDGLALGTHTFRMECPGYVSRQASVSLSIGQQQVDFTVELHREPAVEEPALEKVDVPRSRHWWSRWWPF